jgi:hypothetical protein
MNSNLNKSGRVAAVLGGLAVMATAGVFASSAYDGDPPVDPTHPDPLGPQEGDPPEELDECGAGAIEEDDATPTDPGVIVTFVPFENRGAGDATTFLLVNCLA